MRHRSFRILTRFLFVISLSSVAGCETRSAESIRILSTTSAPCHVQTLRFPTTREEFQRLYAGRGFYTDGQHLGRDIALAEGTAIHPIACGVVRVYRSATGYGTLAVVIEHALASPRTVTNGLGSAVTITHFLSIYGHVRPTTLLDSGDELAFREGDVVGPDDVIGFVQNDTLNGDGAEHLHLGIRLQNAEEAAATDQSWFRGYDGQPSMRNWFADPANFLTALMSQGIAVRWHPTGTTLWRQTNESEAWWVVGQNGLIHPLARAEAQSDHRLWSAIAISDEERRCYVQTTAYAPELTNARLLKFDDASAVYEYQDQPKPIRRAFISQAAFDSWGWRANDILVKPATERVAFQAQYQDLGYRRIRDGTPVKGFGASEVSIVSDGRRLPVFDWSTFVALGYQAERILEIDPLTLDAVAFPRGPMITPEIASYCHYPSNCLGDDCFPGLGGGGVTDMQMISVDAGAAPDLAIKLPEVCNGKDDDGNDLVDEIFLCPLGRQGPICVTACGANGFRRCEAPACDWSVTCYPFVEQCDNTIDDDCDGHTDCADPDCAGQQICRPKVDMTVLVDAGVVKDAGIPPPLPDLAMVLTNVRYEFRVTDGSWQADAPFTLFDSRWNGVVCQNTKSTVMESIANGWYRCDTPQPVTPFVGNFFSKAHPDWGFKGHIATVGNFPKHCTPTSGVEWRLTDLASGKTFYTGPADNLACVILGLYDFHALPPFP